MNSIIKKQSILLLTIVGLTSFFCTGQALGSEDVFSNQTCVLQNRLVWKCACGEVYPYGARCRTPNCKNYGKN